MMFFERSKTVRDLLLLRLRSEDRPRPNPVAGTPGALGTGSEE